MADIEDAEDAEIQRQLLEAKQRIAYLRRQVEREQKLREEQQFEEKQANESKGEMKVEEEPQQQVDEGQKEQVKNEESIPTPKVVVTREDESTKVANLQQQLESSLNDTTARRVPGANSTSRPSSRAGRSARKENMAKPPRPQTSPGKVLDGREEDEMRRPNTGTGLPVSPNKKTPKRSKSANKASKKVSSRLYTSPAENMMNTQRPNTSGGMPSDSFGLDGVEPPGSAKSTRSRRGRKKSSRPSTAYSYTPSERLSPTRKGYTEEHVKRAQQISLEELTRLMNEDVFKEATKRKGIEDKELIPRRKSYFRHQNNRAALLSKDHAEIRYQHYERRRMQLLAMVLREQDVVQAEMDKEAAMFRREDEKLANGFHTTLTGETKRLKQIEQARAKFQKVQAAENNLIINKRKTFNASKGKFETRLDDIMAQEREKARRYRERGLAQKRRIAQVAAMKEKMTKIRAEEMQRRFAKRDQRIFEKMEAKRKIVAERRTKDSGKQQLLKSKQAMAKKVIEDRKIQLVNRLHQKESHVLKMRLEHEREMEKRRIDKALRMQQRVENVARAKKEQEYRNSVMIKKMKMSWDRMNRMKEIKQAIQDDRGSRRKREIIERHKWRDNTILQRNILPGPGEYHNNKTDMANNAKGARWGKYKPKSDIDWIMYRSAQIPGPGQYTPNDPNHKGKSSGSWGKYKPKSDVEWLMYYAEQKPGPGQYSIKHARDKSQKAVKWGDFEPMGEIDQIMSRAKHIPGPAEYAEKPPPLVKPKLSDIKRQMSGSLIALGIVGKMKKKVKDTREKIALEKSQSEGNL
eukprot:g3775.t1